MVGDVAGSGEAARRRRPGSAARARTRAWSGRSAPGTPACALLEGRFDDAERLAAEARPDRRAHRRIPTRGPCTAATAGCSPSSAAQLRRGLRVLRARARRFNRGAVQWAQAFVGRALFAAGRTRGSGRAPRAPQPRRASAVVPRNIRWTGTVVEVANLCADLGDAERAAELAALLEPVAGAARRPRPPRPLRRPGDPRARPPLHRSWVATTRRASCSTKRARAPPPSAHAPPSPASSSTSPHTTSATARARRHASTAPPRPPCAPSSAL